MKNNNKKKTVDTREKDCAIRNKKIERIKKKSRDILIKEFPNPENRALQIEFEQKWTVIINSLNNTFGSLRDYKIALNHLVNNIKDYKEALGWDINIPTYLITHKPDKQLCSALWIKQAWAFQYSYQSWFDSYIQSVSADTVEQCYQALMLSFMCHSGHCNVHLVSTFSSILTGPIKLNMGIGLPFIALAINAKGFNTNIRSGDSAKTQYICYISPLTQGLIRCWNNMDLSKWIPKLDNNQIYHAITNGLVNTNPPLSNNTE